MVKLVEDNFENIIVIINSSNAMELGFVEDEAIDAALWIGGLSREALHGGRSASC